MTDKSLTAKEILSNIESTEEDKLKQEEENKSNDHKEVESNEISSKDNDKDKNLDSVCSKNESDAQSETTSTKDNDDTSNKQEIPNETDNKSNEEPISKNENEEEEVVVPKDLNLPSKESDLVPSKSTVSTDIKEQVRLPESTNYSIKWIEFNKVKIPIIMQNENGPCPLIAICNVLLLRENMSLRPNLETITSTDLMHKLADTLFNVYIPRWTKQNEEKSSDRLDIEKNIDDTLSKFNKLQIGLDVNVLFSGCKKFEYTSELDIFDLFGINLYHGWLIDPQQQELFENFSDKSYNKLVEFLLNNENNGDDDQKKSLSLLAENFLQITASQLTYYGLSELYSHIDRNELAILFRNNHFSTVYKNPNDNKLYILCTDQGYLSHADIVWETLDNIEGDGEFCDSNFNLFIESKLGVGRGATGLTNNDNNVQESDCQNE